MRKRQKTRCVFVALLSLSLITGCATIEYVLPTDLPPPELFNSDDPREIEQDYITLVGQDIKWRLKMNAARFIVGEITEEEYNDRRIDLLDRLKIIGGG